VRGFVLIALFVADAGDSKATTAAKLEYYENSTES
jgi:hypothetical protein